jgi:hypothetical protein
VHARRGFFQKSFFNLEYSTYICIVNQLNNNKMEKVILGFFTAWSWVLGATVLVALSYAIVQLCLGNYHSTASFEF